MSVAIATDAIVRVSELAGGQGADCHGLSTVDGNWGWSLRGDWVVRSPLIQVPPSRPL
ncbi:MAG: hypothetical protein AB4042_11550 [Leptolyngbyaceae cyanobacterium]